MGLSRRELVATSFAAAAGFGSDAMTLSSPENGVPDNRLKVVCVGGHPDDPESGCGGALALYTKAGHQVTVVYLTRGERGIQGKTLDEAATIRTAEAQEACRILGAKPVFAYLFCRGSGSA